MNKKAKQTWWIGWSKKEKSIIDFSFLVFFFVEVWCLVWFEQRMMFCLVLFKKKERENKMKSSNKEVRREEEMKRIKILSSVKAEVGKTDSCSGLVLRFLLKQKTKQKSNLVCCCFAFWFLFHSGSVQRSEKAFWFFVSLWECSKNKK